MNKILKIYLKKSKFNLSLIILGVLILSAVNILTIKILQKIIEDGFIARSYKIVIIYSITLIVLYLLRTFLSILVGISFAKLGQKIVSMIRRDLYNRVLMFPLDYFTKKESNYINTRLQEINNIKEFFSPNIIAGITSIIDFIFVVILLCNINYILYLIILIPVPAFFFMNKKIFKKFSELNEESLEENAKYNAKVNETIRGI